MEPDHEPYSDAGFGLAARSGRALTPPYISFLGFKLLIRLLKKDGIPQRIDRSILRGVPNAAPNQVAAALGYLGLTDADGRPQPMLHRLVETFGTDPWQYELAAMVRLAYPAMFELDLSSVTPAQFEARFAESYPGTREVQRKSRTFFLHAAREAELGLSLHLTGRTKPRRLPAATSVTRKRTPKPVASIEAPSAVAPARLSDLLMARFDPKTMDRTVQEAVWTVFKHFREMDC